MSVQGMIITWEHSLLLMSLESSEKICLKENIHRTRSISLLNGLMDFLFSDSYQSCPSQPKQERILHESIPGCYFYITNRWRKPHEYQSQRLRKHHWWVQFNKYWSTVAYRIKCRHLSPAYNTRRDETLGSLSSMVSSGTSWINVSISSLLSHYQSLLCVLLLLSVWLPLPCEPLVSKNCVIFIFLSP